MVSKQRPVLELGKSGVGPEGKVPMRDHSAAGQRGQRMGLQAEEEAAGAGLEALLLFEGQLSRERLGQRLHGALCLVGRILGGVGDDRQGELDRECHFCCILPGKYRGLLPVFANDFILRLRGCCGSHRERTRARLI